MYLRRIYGDNQLFFIPRIPYRRRIISIFIYIVTFFLFLGTIACIFTLLVWSRNNEEETIDLYQRLIFGVNFLLGMYNLICIFTTKRCGVNDEFWFKLDSILGRILHIKYDESFEFRDKLKRNKILTASFIIFKVCQWYKTELLFLKFHPVDILYGIVTIAPEIRRYEIFFLYITVTRMLLEGQNLIKEDLNTISYSENSALVYEKCRDEFLHLLDLTKYVLEIFVKFFLLECVIFTNIIMSEIPFDLLIFLRPLTWTRNELGFAIFVIVFKIIILIPLFLALNELSKLFILIKGMKKSFYEIALKQIVGSRSAVIASQPSLQQDYSDGILSNFSSVDETYDKLFLSMIIIFIIHIVIIYRVLYKKIPDLINMMVDVVCGFTTKEIHLRSLKINLFWFSSLISITLLLIGCLLSVKLTIKPPLKGIENLDQLFQFDGLMLGRSCIYFKDILGRKDSSYKILYDKFCDSKKNHICNLKDIKQNCIGLAQKMKNLHYIIGCWNRNGTGIFLSDPIYDWMKYYPFKPFETGAIEKRLKIRKMKRM